MSIVNLIQHCIKETLKEFALFFENFVGSGLEVKNFSHFYWKTIEFSPLQWTLFKVLSLLLFFTSLLINYSWKIYGKVISNKFVRPSTLKEIEELKLSVAKLKLPKEHSPRI